MLSIWILLGCSCNLFTVCDFPPIMYCSHFWHSLDCERASDRVVTVRSSLLISFSLRPRLIGKESGAHSQINGRRKGIVHGSPHHALFGSQHWSKVLLSANRSCRFSAFT
ncbi:hypothetical protein EV702DRAFT_129717 [Suillus placidus]|uniref:Secreted protein n=1 Tax=Suillus placidus TaxID=48579 RepID=A0A9P6ZGJ0_9AGAM|nr:hypothetical protein EV702DRAFT_129717 [Suillus placidus]